MSTEPKCCKQRTYRIVKSFRINTYEKQGVVGGVMVNQKSDRDFCPVYPEPRREREQRVEGSLLLSDEDACPKLIDGEGFGLFINVVFRFQPLQLRLKKGLRLIRRAADGLCHFFGGVREVAGIGSHSRERQMADPVVCVLLGNLGIQLKGALGVSLALQAARIRIKLNRAGLERQGNAKRAF